MILEGYHATSLQNAQRILATEYEYSDKANWLGAGVYFWGDAQPFVSGLECARWWVGIKGFSPWCILKSEIRSERIFDCVNDERCKRAFVAIKKQLLEKFAGSDITEQEYIDGIFAKIKRKFDVIVFFTKGDAMQDLQAADRLIVNLQVQMCVSDTSCIWNTEGFDEGN